MSCASCARTATGRAPLGSLWRKQLQAASNLSFGAPGPQVLVEKTWFSYGFRTPKAPTGAGSSLGGPSISPRRCCAVTASRACNCSSRRSSLQVSSALQPDGLRGWLKWPLRAFEARDPDAPSLYIATYSLYVELSGNNMLTANMLRRNRLVIGSLCALDLAQMAR